MVNVTKLIEELKEGFHCTYHGDCWGELENKCKTCDDYKLSITNFEKIISEVLTN